MFDPKILRLVAITDDAEDRRATLTDRVAAAVRGGATSVQVRLKAATPREVVEITRSIICRVSVPVIVNDRADIALAAGAAGVHVGEADLPVAAIRRFAPANFIIEASLESDAELPNAKGADYVGIGPVYGWDSKSDAGSGIGVAGFKRLAALVEHPALAVGGITADRALQITVAGAAGVAVINAIFKGDDPEKATRGIRAANGKGGRARAGPLRAPFLDPCVPAASPPARRARICARRV